MTFDPRLTYECPDNCSGRGVCDDNGTCSCFTGWAGQFCQLSVCPNDCFSNGICNDSIGACQCYDGFTGNDGSAILLVSSRTHSKVLTHISFLMQINT